MSQSKKILSLAAVMVAGCAIYVMMDSAAAA